MYLLYDPNMTILLLFIHADVIPKLDDTLCHEILFIYLFVKILNL